MRSLFLSGFPGTGKTTVAPLVAARLGIPWVDTDEELARRVGMPVADVWRTRGETAFREIEGDIVRALATDDVLRVVALGGGAVTARPLRHLLLDRGFLVTLTSRPATLLQRLGDLSSRPTLVARDPLARITTLLADRAALYAECHISIATDDVSPVVVADRVSESSRRERVVVALGSRSYPVDVVADEPLAVTGALRALSPSSVVVVTDENVRAARGLAIAAALEGLGVPEVHVTLAPGESQKTLKGVERIWDAALGAVDRRAVVLGIGGGVTGDLAGFAASTLLRGLRVVQAPTSLLAMVDASVGGKTGFDAPAGKNLIGSFHQPSAVVVDLAHLVTLPRVELVCGLAEVAKVALACDAGLWDDLETYAERLVFGDVAVLAPVIRQAIAIKARIVRDDETEAGERALLNLGHTFGHALEAAGGYVRHRHGEAVAIGLVLECRAAERIGTCRPGLANRVEALLARLELPTSASPDDLALAEPLLARDKKRAGGSLVLPLPTRLGQATLKSVTVRDLVNAVRG